MKRILSSTLLTGLVASLLTACGSTPLPSQSLAPRFQAQQRQTESTRELLVRFRISLSAAHANEFNAKYGVHLRQFVPALNAYVVEIDNSVGLPAAQVVRYLSQDPMVLHAEINGRMEISPVKPEMQISPIFSTQR
ncbi:MAG: S8 family serine peptidase [Candidatus Sericytochromatia bacterium]